MKRLHPSVPIPCVPRGTTTPAGEVNERYRQHPATGGFTVRTEGEITQWDTFT
jgi:hypothetical protein